MAKVGFLDSKVILILTPQAWGKMLLAKHHYAIELAKRGNEVYFLNPPDNQRFNLKTRRKRIEIISLSGYPNLFVINQELFFPYELKFHLRGLYNLLIKWQIKQIIKTIPKPVDLIWSFDLGNLFPLKLFEKRLFKIFHPVDEPRDRQAILAAAGANILFSVTREIIDKYKNLQVPSLFVNHGLADEFLEVDSKPKVQDTGINVGLSGNFLRPDLDRKVLLQIIRGNPAVIFNFYGIYKIAHSNIGASDDTDTVNFINHLQGFENVNFHGVLKTTDLARALNKMDAFLICYNIELDQSHGTNYHKIMEYLSTGKVIISNNISTYQEFPELVRMCESRIDNEALVLLFQETIIDLDNWNADTLLEKRINFARSNTYCKQIERIERYIADLTKFNTGI